jgi:hypothetical protein
VSKPFPLDVEDALVADSDLAILSSQCSLGFLHAMVRCLPQQAGADAVLELTLALATLWLRHPKEAVRHWCLLRLNRLIALSGPEVVHTLQGMMQKGQEGASLLVQEEGSTSSLQDSQEGPEQRRSGDNGDSRRRSGGLSPPGGKATAGPGASESESEDEGGSGDADRQRATDPAADSGASAAADVLSSRLFRSCMAEGGGEQLNALELAVLLVRVGLNGSTWAIDRLSRGLVLPERAQYDFKLAREVLIRAGLAADGHQRPGSLVGDNSLGVTLQELAQSLWETLQTRFAFEDQPVRAGDQLMHTTFTRQLVRLCAALRLRDTEEEGRQHWYPRYSRLARVLQSLMLRRPFPEAFLTPLRVALGGYTSAVAAAGGGTVLDCFDNSQFRPEMDAELIHWRTLAPDFLKLALKGRHMLVQHCKLKFSVEGVDLHHLEFGDEQRSVALQRSVVEQNTWIVAEEVFTAGVYYWCVRCDCKGSTRRYVGVGVGKDGSPFPVGAARLLSDGHLKSASQTMDIPQGFGAEDVVGILLDMDQATVAFDVNGVKRGEIALPDLQPGDGVRPLVYLFSAQDKFTFLQNVPVPPCHEAYYTDQSFYVPLLDRPLALRSEPLADASMMGELPPSCPPGLAQQLRFPTVRGSGVGPRTSETTAVAESASPLSTDPAPAVFSGTDETTGAVAYAVQALEARNNSSGLWLRLANAQHRFGPGPCWCLLRPADGSYTLRLLPPAEAARTPVLNLMDTPVAGSEEAALRGAPDGARRASCVSQSQRHMIRAGPFLEAMEIGQAMAGAVVFYTTTVASVDGIWLLLHDESKRQMVERNMVHLDAYTLKESSQGVHYFQVDEEAESAVDVPPECPSLKGVDLESLRRRSHVLDHISQALMPLLPAMDDAQEEEGATGAVLGIGSTDESLRLLQGLLMLPHKERALKAILSRTNTTNTRVTITLNRVQIKRDAQGLAGPEGRASVFAQAASELRHVERNVFLQASRCWKVRFSGEGG